MTSEWNPYSPTHESKKWNVAELLLSGDTVSYDDLRLVAGGALSPRTFGQILRDLEGQQLSFLRIRDPALGSLYRFDQLVPFDERFRLAKHDGPDALRHVEDDDPHPGHEGDAAGDDGWHPDDLDENEVPPHPRTVVEVMKEFLAEEEEEEAAKVTSVPAVAPEFTSAEGVDVDMLFFHEDDDDIPPAG